VVQSWFADKATEPIPEELAAILRRMNESTRKGRHIAKKRKYSRSAGEDVKNDGKVKSRKQAIAIGRRENVDVVSLGTSRDQKEWPCRQAGPFQLCSQDVVSHKFGECDR
jgi:hypothetical protein